MFGTHRFIVVDVIVVSSSLIGIIGAKAAEAGSSGGFVGRTPTLSEDTLTALMEYRCSDLQARQFLARSVSEHARRRVSDYN